MREIFERTRFLEIQDYPRSWQDCLKQALSELNDASRDAVNCFDITYDEFHDNCFRVYPLFKRGELRYL